MNRSWELLELRARITQLDVQLLVLLAQRFAVVREIQAIKRAHGMPARDGERERQVLAGVRRLSDDLGVDPMLAESVWQRLFAASEASLTHVKAGAAPGTENASAVPHERKGERQ